MEQQMREGKKLRDRVAQLEEEVESGRPQERQIIAMAQSQARREAETRSWTTKLSIIYSTEIFPKIK